MARLRMIQTRRGVRLTQHGVLISEIRRAPGPTHGFFDLLAALIRVYGTGKRTALLGFAGGGLMAPLRAMGYADGLRAVDLSSRGYRLFQDLCLPWGEPVRWAQAEAAAWLRGQRGGFELILDDLSVSANGDITKPEVSWTVLPTLIQRRLAPQGVAVFNLLKPPGDPWQVGLRLVSAPYAHAVVLRPRDYENRILVVSSRPLEARRLTRQLRHHLASLGSRMAAAFRVESVSAGLPGTLFTSRAR